MQNLALSVIITCHNEEENMGELLASLVNWAAEIIVVDSFSTDQTVRIIQQFDAVRLFQRPYRSPADQKNWALEQCTQPWVLLLDADERLTPALKNAIAAALEHPTAKGYAIRRLNYFMGKLIRYSGWQNDWVVRLVQRGEGRYNEVLVHEQLVLRQSSPQPLAGEMLHLTYKNYEDYMRKFERYTTWSALDRRPKTPAVTALHLVWKPFFRFLRHYLFKGGFLDGKQGLVVSLLSAYSVFSRYLKLWRLQEGETLHTYQPPTDITENTPSPLR